MQHKNTERQVFWFSAINYLGIVIGLFSVVFIYPNDKEFLGIIKYVDAATKLMLPIIVFGGAKALIYFYPGLDKKQQQLLFTYGMVTIIIISIVLFVLLVAGQYFFASEKYHYLYFAFPSATALAFVELFKRQATNLQKLAVPTFYERIIPKLALPLIFILLLTGLINEVEGLIAFILAYFILLAFLANYLFKIYKVNFSFRFKPLFAEISKNHYYSYSFFALIASLGSFLAFRIDALMIPQFLTFEDNGSYAIGLSLASAVAIPATGMFTIYSPLISEHIKKNRMVELGKKYIETATFLVFIGGVFYSSIVLGIDDFFHLMPTYDRLADSIPVIMVLGISVVINMGTGFNNEIISYSDYFKFNILFVSSLAVLNIILNLYFLTSTNLGMIGVAYASLISMVVFNTIKLVFISKKFGLLPFDTHYFKVLGIILLVGTFLYFLPSASNHLGNLIFKVGLNISVVIVLSYKLKLVYSLNYWIDKLLKGVRQK